MVGVSEFLLYYKPSVISFQMLTLFEVFDIRKHLDSHYTGLCCNKNLKILTLRVALYNK